LEEIRAHFFPYRATYRYLQWTGGKYARIIMFDKVLLPTDFSEYADDTLESILDVPGVRDVLLLYVTDDHQHAASPVWISGHVFESPAKKIETLLEKRRLRIEEAGIRAGARIVEAGYPDSIAEVIIRTSEAEDASLIAMGARGRGRVSTFILGSVSSRVLQSSRRDVLIIHKKAGDQPNPKSPHPHPGLFSKVLCPIDFSRPSENAVSTLSAIPEKGDVILLHVVPEFIAASAFREKVTEVARSLDEVQAPLEQSGWNVRICIRFGNPGEVISRLASEEAVSLILMSRYGKRDYTRNILIGSTTADVAKHVGRPLLVRFPDLVFTTTARELSFREFPMAEEIWQHYHQQRGNPETDRIFGVFVDETPVSVARCRKHPDGWEVDGVFVPDEYRGRGYARLVMTPLIRDCGVEPLYMHSTLELVPFYASFGFRPIKEQDLPPTIRERFNFALGEMQGSNVSPMKREGVPGQPGS
jgi:nucleotide-binding universal stress UspA family protein/GNAT superfamily N-acetyltransferase